MAVNPAASLLEIERDRLLCSLQHLERSVKELKEAFAEDPDQEYKAAISENLVVVAKQRARVQCLEDEIKRAKGAKGDISHAQVVAVPVTEAPTAQQASHQQETNTHNPPQQPSQTRATENAVMGVDAAQRATQQASSVISGQQEQQQAVPAAPTATSAAAAAGQDTQGPAGGVWL